MEFHCPLLHPPGSWGPGGQCGQQLLLPVLGRKKINDFNIRRFNKSLGDGRADQADLWLRKKNKLSTTLL